MSRQTIIPPSAATNGPITYAGFMDRFIALLIDYVLLYIFQLVFFMPLTSFFLSATGIGPSSFFVTSLEGEGAFFSSSMLLYWIYFASFESSQSGATPGKRAMNLRVVDEDGLRISFAMALLRYVGKFVSAFPLMLGFIMAIFTRRHQALHDFIAKTMVIEVDG